MDKHYYIVAQLPMLFFDREPAMSSEAFLREAEKWMSESEFDRLRRARYDSTDLTVQKPVLLKQYVEREHAFRRDLAQWRKAQREGQEFKPETFSPALVKEGNPLEIERNLLLNRWKLIEELEAGHHFDLEFLILYFFKLQILEKLALFNKEKGRQAFQTISKVDL